MEIYLARSQGFCAGVANAIDIVELALKKYGPPIYVYHDIVHNTAVITDFKSRGVVFVEDIMQVPEGAHAIFSAHGIPPSIKEGAQKRQLHFIDATCPLVTKVHKEAVHFSEKNYPIVLIGHRGHQELTGTAGYIKPELLNIIETEHEIEGLELDTQRPVAYLTQTTLSVDDTTGIITKLKKKFPYLVGPPRSDICYATQNRQDAVKELAKLCDVIVICGSPNSSNSNRLRETGEQSGCPSYIIDHAEELDLDVLKDARKVGISSGASVPRYIVEALINRIKSRYTVEEVHSYDDPEKNIVFSRPPV